MHGLGDTPEGWGSIVPKALRVQGARCCYDFPAAPEAKVSCNDGDMMTSWFDMEVLPLDSKTEPPLHGCCLSSAEASVKRLHARLDKMRASGIPSEKLVIGGFSQGGAMAMLSAMRYPHRLGAVICFSGILLDADRLSEIATPESKQVPIFWGHGEDDAILCPSLQELGVKRLEEAGFRVEARCYPDEGHEPMKQALADASRFLTSIFRAPAEPPASGKPSES